MKLYKIIFENVREIIKVYDPVGLIDGGAPDDEYHDEINKIVSILHTEIEREELVGKIKSIFNGSFGDGVKQDDNLFFSIADKLMELKRRLRW